jgi:hypothetical protein
MLDAPTRLLLKSAVKSLDALQSSIHNFVNAITENKKADGPTDEPPVAPPTNIVVSLPAAITAYYETEHSERSVRSKRENTRRRIEYAGIGTAVLLALFTGLTLKEVSKQAKSAQQQVGIMQKQLEAADRPWIKIRVEASRDITYTASGDGQFYFSAVMKNIGHSVATEVALKFAVVVPKGNGVFTEPVERQRKLCGTPPKSIVKDSDHDLRSSVFPGDETEPLGFGTNISVMEMKDGALHFPSAADGKPVTGTFFSPYLVGCVDYTFGTATIRHQTGFIYNIARTDSRDVHPLAFKMGGVVPRAKVFLERYVFGGDYAY